MVGLVSAAIAAVSAVAVAFIGRGVKADQHATTVAAITVEQQLVQCHTELSELRRLLVELVERDRS